MYLVFWWKYPFVSLFVLTFMRMQGQASFAGCPVLLTSPAAAGQAWKEVSGTFPRAVGFIASYGLVEGFWCCFVFQLISGAAVVWSFSSNCISPVGFFIEFPRLFCVSTFQINTEAPPGHSSFPRSPPCLLFPASCKVWAQLKGWGETQESYV